MDKSWVMLFWYNGSVIDRRVLHEGVPVPRVGERVKIKVSDIPSWLTTQVKAVQYDYEEAEINLYFGEQVW